MDILKETEADTKNFFGSYGSQRMKDWQEVVSAYKRNNVYLAEAAQLLSQSCSYEIPGLKKALTKSAQVQQECEKKEKDNLRKAAEFRSEFRKSCDQLGIKGDKIRQEIIELLSGLPETYGGIAEDSKELKGARLAYKEFLKTALEEDKNDVDVLPTLGFLMEKGNVTTYEWIHGEKPLSVEEPTLDFGDDDEDKEDANADVIDFGDDDDGGGIDFGDDAGGGGGEIDWGNLDAGGEDANAEIDWGTGDVADAALDTSAIVVEDGGVSGGVARDSEALSMLDNRRTRTSVLDELTELLCFLEQRLFETEAAEEGTGRYSSLAASMSSSSDLSVEKLRKYVVVTKNLIDRLNTGKIHHLQLIRYGRKRF